MKQLRIIPTLLLGMSSLVLVSCVDYSKYPHLKDEVELLQFYKVRVDEVAFLDTITVLEKESNELVREYNGYFFVNVKVNLVVNNSDDAKPYKLDTNDFKLKNHIGTALSTSGERFSVIEAMEDYTWCDKTISKGETFSFDVNFKFNKSVDLKKCLMVLEVDFSNVPGNHVDIILSENSAEFLE